MNKSDKMLGELVTSRMELQRENRQLRRDNDWLRRVLAIALERCPALVVRRDELERAPAFVLDENMADEIIVTIKKERPAATDASPFDDLY